MKMSRKKKETGKPQTLRNKRGEVAHFDYTTPSGTIFLQGYRKFIVAVLWVILMWIVVLKCIFSVPTAGQVTICIWMISGCGLFAAFFAGGNTLAKLWSAKYGPPQTTANFTQQDVNTKTEVKEEKSVQYQIKVVNPMEDAAFAEEVSKVEAKLPPIKI